MGEVKSEIAMRSDNFIAIRDIQPKAEGHMLVIPKQHYTTLLDIPNKIGNELLEFMKKVAASLLSEKYGTGFNVVTNNFSVAGQVVMHAHLHIIPRKDGDGLRMM